MAAPRLLALLCLVASTGCATIFSSSDQAVSFSSNPQGAEVLVDGVPIGVTPMTTRFDRNTFATRVITIRRAGAEPTRFFLQKTLNAVAILNLTSLLSWVTDAATGALIEYSPGAYHVELRPAFPTPPMGPGGYSLEPRPGADREALWFVLVNDSRLRTEIARGGGEYTRTLARIWGIEQASPRLSRALRRRAPDLLATEYPYHLYLGIRAAVMKEKILGSSAISSR